MLFGYKISISSFLVLKYGLCGRPFVRGFCLIILRENLRYSQRSFKGVFNMFLMEYDYKDDIASQREESFELGLAKGRVSGLEEGRLEDMRLMMDNLKLSLPQVMDALKIPSEERDKYASLLS